MLAKKSKKLYTHSSQLNRRITEGKRKEESYGLVLSSQDVFSDSANLEGMQQKTSCLFDTGQGIRAQLEEKNDLKTKKRTAGGRKKLQQNQRRKVKLQLHVTTIEYEMLNEQFQATGMRFMSDYLRMLVLDKRKAGSITNKKELIKQLDSVGTQIRKIGNNINQIAKYANIQVKSGKVDQTTLTSFNQHMSQYQTLQQELVKAFRALIRNKG